MKRSNCRGATDKPPGLARAETELGYGFAAEFTHTKHSVLPAHAGNQRVSSVPVFALLDPRVREDDGLRETTRAITQSVKARNNRRGATDKPPGLARAET